MQSGGIKAVHQECLELEESYQEYYNQYTWKYWKRKYNIERTEVSSCGFGKNP